MVVLLAGSSSSECIEMILKTRNFIPIILLFLYIEFIIV